MMRRVELLLGIGAALAAVAAIIATIFAPVATTALSIDGAAPVVHHIYARDFGLIPMLVVTVSIAALAACVALGAYYHTRRASIFGRAIMWAAALAYIVLIATSLREGGFATYPAVLALACALVALVPSRAVSSPVWPRCMGKHASRMIE